MHSKNSQLLRAAIVTVIIAGIFGALSVLAEGIGILSGKIFAICLSLIIFGITATISMVVTRKPEYINLGRAGMLVSATAFLLVLTIILGEVINETLLKITFAFFISSIALAHISLLHYFNLQNKYAFYARIVATIAISIFSLILIMRVFEPFMGVSSLIYNQSTLKMLIASFIIDLAATLLVPLCNRLMVDKPVEFSFTEEQPVQPKENEISE